MEDDSGVYTRSDAQSSGYDIGPNEDRFNPANGTSVDMLYLHTNSQGEMEIQSQPVIVAPPRNGIYFEPLDETPSFPHATDTKFYSEAERLKTYKDRWLEDDYHVKPADLARNGFIHVGPGDKVVCVFCLRTLRNWEPNDSVEREHGRHYPDCPFVCGKCDHQNVPINPVDSMKRNMGLRMKSEDQQSSQAEFSMQDYSNRVRTYQGWPKDAPVRPDALAAAGLFYCGTADRVQCFSCKKVLENWELGDDPCVEHAKWSPKCAHLQSIKGSDYVNQILHQKMNGNGSAAHMDVKIEHPVGKITNSGAPYNKNEAAAMKQQSQEPRYPSSSPSSLFEDLQEDLNNPAVRAIIETYDVPKALMKEMLREIRHSRRAGPRSLPLREVCKKFDVPVEAMTEMLSKLHFSDS